jgi:hypothetical protein
MIQRNDGLYSTENMNEWAFLCSKYVSSAIEIKQTEKERKQAVGQHEED